MLRLEGKPVAAFHRERVERKLYEYEERHQAAELAIVLAGSDKASAMYAKSMKRVAEDMGLTATIHTFPDDVEERELVEKIEEFNGDDAVIGILIMMPLPTHICAQHVINCMEPKKDIDGLTDSNVAHLFTGQPGFVPCTPQAVMAIFDYYHISLTGKEVVIIGRSNVVGKPLAQLCLNRNATVTHCHSRTRSLKEATLRADIIISAAGSPGLITKDMVKAGAVVIDVGINRVQGKTVGDVDFDGVATVASAITPVPGGVGAVTTTMVLENAVCGFHHD